MISVSCPAGEGTTSTKPQQEPRGTLPSALPSQEPRVQIAHPFKRDEPWAYSALRNRSSQAGSAAYGPAHDPEEHQTVSYRAIPGKHCD